MNEIINFVIDGHIGSPEGAEVIVEQEVDEMMKHYGMNRKEARTNLITRIHSTATRYLPAEQAEIFLQLFKHHKNKKER
jgi:hypothetical protein